ncbi:Glutathione S-transferase L3 [Bienertia sinuspersici]
MATPRIEEVLPPFLSSNSDPPALFDGTTRCYTWPTTALMPTGLHAKIQLIPIELNDKPAWYKEKVYPADKVPALEHNNKIIGESLDLIRYMDSHFEGPSLFPDDPVKKEFVEELFAYSNQWNTTLVWYLKGTTPENEMRAAMDKLEEYLSRYNEGPFLLGAQFSAADVVYAPFVHRYYPLCIDLHKYDILEGRPKLAAWLKALDAVEAFIETKWDTEQNIKIFKRINLGTV